MYILKLVEISAMLTKHTPAPVHNTTSHVYLAGLKNAQTKTKTHVSSVFIALV